MDNCREKNQIKPHVLRKYLKCERYCTQLPLIRRAHVSYMAAGRITWSCIFKAKDFALLKKPSSQIFTWNNSLFHNSSNLPQISVLRFLHHEFGWML